MLSSDVTRTALGASGWIKVTGLRIWFALAGKFALFTRRRIELQLHINQSDITIGPTDGKVVQMSELQMGKAWHRAIREGEYVMNPAAAILRRAQDSMRLADCAHGTVTQLTGHIIARRSTPPESGSWSGWRSLDEMEDCEKDEGRSGCPTRHAGPCRCECTVGYR